MSAYAMRGGSDGGPTTVASQSRLHAVVIGAGGAGLVALREMLREGHQATILESELALGGVWRYTEAVESDLTGVQAPNHLSGSRLGVLHQLWPASTPIPLNPRETS